MVSFIKFDDYPNQLALGLHHFNAAGDKLMVFLTNDAPDPSVHTGKGTGGGAKLNGITEEHGYAPADIQNDMSATGGVATITAIDVVWTATGGSFGPFQYVVIYNDTHPNKALIGYVDLGHEITVLTSDFFRTRFDVSLITIT